MASKASEWRDKKERLQRDLADHLNNPPDGYVLYDSYGGHVRFATHADAHEPLISCQRITADEWRPPTRDDLVALASWILATFGDQEGA